MANQAVLGTRHIIVAAATAAVENDKPAIGGTVTLHCVDSGEPLRLVMPMLDAMLLLNSLRQIETSFALEQWSNRLGCSLNAIDQLGAELRDQYSPIEVDSTALIAPPHLIN